MFLTKCGWIDFRLGSGQWSNLLICGAASRPNTPAVYRLLLFEALSPINVGKIFGLKCFF